MALENNLQLTTIAKALSLVLTLKMAFHVIKFKKCYANRILMASINCN